MCDFRCGKSHLNVAPESQDFWVRLFAPKTFRCGLLGAKKSHLKVSFGAKNDFQVRKKSHLLLFFVLVMVCSYLVSRSALVNSVPSEDT